MHRAAKSALLLPLAALAACVAPSTPAPRAPAAPVVRQPSYSPIGLETVMGKTAATLQAQLGRPDLDIHEGSARKLQFGGPICVLDAYLYPPTRGGEPVVRHIDARLLDGRDMDRASCLAALSRRPGAR